MRYGRQTCVAAHPSVSLSWRTRTLALGVWWSRLGKVRQKRPGRGTFSFGLPHAVGLHTACMYVKANTRTFDLRLVVVSIMFWYSRLTTSTYQSIVDSPIAHCCYLRLLVPGCTGQ
jgi:hypothetical protein